MDWVLSHITHLNTGQVSILSCYVDGRVSILVNFIQRDGLFLHELKQPQQDLLLQRDTTSFTDCRGQCGRTSHVYDGMI